MVVIGTKGCQSEAEAWWLRTSRVLIRLQVQGGKDRVAFFRPLPDGSWAVPLRGDGIRSYRKIPRAWWPKIAEEYAASRTIYLIVQKGKREQAQNSERSMECSDV